VPVKPVEPVFAPAVVFLLVPEPAATAIMTMSSTPAATQNQGRL
jgi:hypothetical protein